jgi:bacterioferritin (cytochrome b1)
MDGVAFPALPALAGLCAYDDAARVGFSVDESVRRLLRLQWFEKRLMEIALAHLPAVPEWEVKCALALQQWQDAEHADAIRRRISEMRSPPPPLDRAPDAALNAFLEELLRAQDTVELIAGLSFARTRLAAAYRAHLAGSNPLVDQPTRRLLRMNLQEEEESAQWCDQALTALTAADDAARERAGAWQRHLLAWLGAAGGVSGDDGGASDATGAAAAGTAGSALPAPRGARPFVADVTPRRDARFSGVHQFEFPPQTVYNAPGVSAEERNLALLCRRALEMDVPETMASFMTERRDRPWEFYRDYARQLWDEARHAMMGTVGLRARGIDWMQLPLHVGFSLRLNLHASPLERQILLYAIEQSLMPGETGKRFEYETAVAAADPLSAHFHDFDWADEVLHAQIGRRWMKHEGITVQDAIRRGETIHERTWPQLAQHEVPRDDDPWQWWRDLVREVLGRESSAHQEGDAPPRIVQQSG